MRRIQYRVISKPNTDQKQTRDYFLKNEQRIDALKLATRKLAEYGHKKDAAICGDLKGYRATRQQKEPTHTRFLQSIKYPHVTIQIGLTERIQKVHIETIRAHVRHIRRQNRTLNHTYRMFKGLEYPLTAGVHSAKGFFVSIQKEIKKKRVFASKRPVNKNRHVGIEIEFLSPNDRDTICDRIVTFGLENSVCLKQDGSLRPEPGDHAHELCLIGNESQIPALLVQVGHLLKSIDAYVNKSCGLHVHVDTRSRDYATVFTNLASAQSLLYAMNPPSRKASTYCQPVRKREFHMPGNRYHGINPYSINEHSTVEVRIHAGTVNAAKIERWVRILIALADAPKIQAPIRSVKRLRDLTGIDRKLATYVKNRIQKFKTPDAESSDSDDDASFVAA